MGVDESPNPFYCSFVPETSTMIDTDLLMRYEIEGLDTDDEVIELFQQIYDAKAYTWLQGHYGRTLRWLIDEGVINI